GVAVAAAKGLSRALGIETVGVYSLLAHAGSGLAIGERVVVTHDARRGNLYAQPCTRLPREPSAGSQEPTALIVSLAAPTKVAADALAERYPDLRVVPSSTPDPAVLAATS